MILNYTNLVDPILKSLRLKVLEVSQIKENSLVLDVCCGTGDQAFYFAKNSDHVFGIDLDPSMLALANKRKQKQKGNVGFSLADASQLPFEDNYFDLVSTCLALHEKNEELRNKVLLEMKRVVKKDGKIIIVDYNTPMPKNPMALVIYITEYLAGKNHFNCFKEYHKRKGLKELLAKIGLKVEKRIFIYKETIELLEIYKN